MYETALALIFLPFLLIIVRVGFKDSIKICYEKKGITIIWLICLILYFTYLAFASSHIQESYQKTLTSQGPITTLQYTYSSLFNPGLLRSL